MRPRGFGTAGSSDGAASIAETVPEHDVCSWGFRLFFSFVVCSLSCVQHTYYYTKEENYY